MALVIFCFFHWVVLICGCKCTDSDCWIDCHEICDAFVFPLSVNCTFHLVLLWRPNVSFSYSLFRDQILISSRHPLKFQLFFVFSF